LSDELVRLNKLMAHKGLCSRREADDLISKGLVSVDGKVVSELGAKYPSSAKIEIAGRGQKILDDKATIIINKPIGYVSSQPEDGYKAAVELVRADTQDGGDKQRFDPRHLRGLAPAGRLDIDSQGLLILTQDGVLAKKIIGEDSDVEKEYIVRVASPGAKGGSILSDADLKRLGDGSLVIEGRQLRPARVEWINEDQLRFVLKEGMKRQIRKMCEAVGLKVTGLKRVRVGKLMLGKLAEGQWRYLSREEQI
jgi:23S rRNA pseudouridine2604 synthase